MTLPRICPEISIEDFSKYAAEFSNDSDFPKSYDEWNGKQQSNNAGKEAVGIPVPFDDYLEYCIRSGLDSNEVTLNSFAVYLHHRD